MRWTELFADLEAQLDNEEAAEQRVEVAERSRRELASITLLDRLAAHLGEPIQLGVEGVGPVRGRLVDAATQWLMIEETPGRAAVVPVRACLWLQGLGRAAAIPAEHSVARRLGLSSALRTLARQRVSVQLHLRDAAQVSGTIDRVHADHLDLAEHPGDEPRRREAVRGVRAVPLRAIAMVRPT
jgi:hypothetical protein